MEGASVRPDTEFRAEDQATAPWHYIDICLQDRRTDVPARCPAGACLRRRLMNIPTVSKTDSAIGGEPEAIWRF
jgi:hypothetical protein